MPNPWDSDPIISAASQAPAGPIYGPPPTENMGLQNENTRVNIQQGQTALANAPLTRENLQTNIAQGQTSITNSRFDNKGNLRKEFNALPEAKNYSEAMTALGGALQAPDNAQGDLGIIYSFAKIMDPGSVVREGEMDMANSTSSYVQDIARKYGQISEGNRLPPQVRQQLVETARAKARALDQAYSQRYRQFSELAQRNGIDPKEIVGDHLGDAFRQVEQQYVRAQTGQGDIGFNREAPPKNPLTPEQQSAYDAFNRANPQASPQQIQQFMGMIGYDIHNAEDIAKLRDLGAGVAAGSEAVYKPDIANMRKGDEVVDPIMRGVADMMTLGLSEEIAAGVDTLANDQSYGQNLANENAIRDYDVQHNFGKRLLGQVGGGAVLPTFGANSVKSLAGVGAGYGAAYGAGSTDGGAQERALGALRGGVAGGATGGALGAVVPLATRGIAAAGRKIAGPPSAEQQAILRAGTEEQVPVNMADIYPETRNTVSALETIPGASGPVRQGIEAGRDAMQGRVAALGGKGQPLEGNVAGQAVQRTADNSIKNSGARFNVQYDRLEKASAGIKVPAKQSLTRVDEVIGKLSELPETNKAEMGYLAGLKSDLSKDLSIGALRRLRTTLRKKISKGELTFGENEADVLSVMDSASQDIASGLAAAGKRDVATQFAKVDSAYRERMVFIKDTVQKLVGKRGANLPPEQVFANLKAMASPKGNEAGLGRFMQEMDPDDAADIAATFADALGQNTKGEFSIAHLVTQAEKFPKATRAHIFGSAGARSIENLLILGRAKAGTVGRLNNSRSGQVGNYRTMLSTVLFGLPGGGALMSMGAGLNASTGAIGGTAIGALALGVSRGVAKALMNEKFTRLLAHAPATTNPAMIDNHIGKIRAIAAKDPNVRALVQSVEQQLIKLANDNAARTGQVAASPNEGPQPQQ